MCASGEKWREERLERSACGQNVINHQDSRTRWDLKSATKLSPHRARVTSDLFCKDAAHAKESTDLIRKEHTTRGWPSHQVNLNGGGLRHDERPLGEKSADFRSGIGMLQQRPLLKVTISMPSTLKEEVPTLQCTCRKKESFNTSGAQRLIV